MSGLVCSIIFQLFVHVDLGDYDRAASQFPDSSSVVGTANLWSGGTTYMIVPLPISLGSGTIIYVVPRDHKFAVPTTERSSYLCGWSKHRPHKHFILNDFPGGPLRSAGQQLSIHLAISY